MSWMDSWSRPKKNGATPPPFYSIPGLENTPYCYSCGRVISSRKSDATRASSTPAKYCSERCKNHKPGKTDRRIESTFVAILNGADPAALLDTHPVNAELPVQSTICGKTQFKKKKGDNRITVMCADVETIIFGSRYDPEKTHGRKRNKPKRTLGRDNTADVGACKITEELSDDNDISTANSEDESITSDKNESYSAQGGASVCPTTNSTRTADSVRADHQGFGAGKMRPAQVEAEVNFSIGGERGWAEKLEETPEMLARRREGQKKADEREMVRCAARRLCVFGYLVGEIGDEGKQENDSRGKTKGKRSGRVNTDMNGTEEKKPGVQEKRKKCEALMNSMVVEPSLAKGEWGIRWRDDQDL
ncbi:hypothetical protein F5Y16DRAFT_403417 [Xylariaceae sp. FL0255]|nr:hypothetical protein F5Y16DRAFT_403417 [Xylariaceae sp. FL0255]